MLPRRAQRLSAFKHPRVSKHGNRREAGCHGVNKGTSLFSKRSVSTLSCRRPEATADSPAATWLLEGKRMCRSAGGPGPCKGREVVDATIGRCARLIVGRITIAEIRIKLDGHCG